MIWKKHFDPTPSKRQIHRAGQHSPKRWFHSAVGIILELAIFGCVLFLVFFLTFQVAGRYLRERLTALLGDAANVLSGILLEIDIPSELYSLIIDGICPGVSSVLSFIPIIASLFFFLALLEEIGYLARISRFLDAPLRRIGLSGHSFLPLVMGFGCSVPAIMSCASIPDGRRRFLTMMLIPFMSCSAKLPIYGIFVTIFFPYNPIAAIAVIYCVGVITALLCSTALSRLTVQPHLDHLAPLTNLYCLDRSAGQYPFDCFIESTFFTSPSLLSCIKNHSAKPPNLRNVFTAVLMSCLGFVKKAFTVILIASAIIWFLQNFDLHLQMTDHIESSILAQLGRSAAPIFALLGFEDWRAAAALIAGLSAKEAVVSTLAILASASVFPSVANTFDTSGSAPLSMMLTEIFTPASAFSFMAFCLLYVPCIATLTVIRKETGSWKYSGLMLLGQTGIAWLVSFIIYHIALLLEMLH